MAAPVERAQALMWKVRSTRRYAQSRGFATVEVLVAVAVVVLVSTVSIMALGQSDRSRLQTDVAAVSLVLQQARLQAAETGRPVAVEYSERDRTIATNRATHVLGRGVTSPNASARIIIRPSGENEGLDLALVAGTLTRSVSIDWLTGQVRVSP